MPDESEGKSFFLSVPFLIFLAVALLIGALQLSISNSVDASPTGFASIITVNEASSGLFFNENGYLKDEYIGQINANLDGVPEYIFKLFGSDLINISVKLENGSTSTYNVRTSANRVTYLKKGLDESATIEVEITEDVINQIMYSADPLNKFLDAFNSRKIKYSGAGVEGAVKETGVGITVGIMGIFNSAISFFGNLFG